MRVESKFEVDIVEDTDPKTIFVMAYNLASFEMPDGTKGDVIASGSQVRVQLHGYRGHVEIRLKDLINHAAYQLINWRDSATTEERK